MEARRWWFPCGACRSRGNHLRALLFPRTIRRLFVKSCSYTTTSCDECHSIALDVYALPLARFHCRKSITSASSPVSNPRR
jgi:hypothetical protein